MAWIKKITRIYGDDRPGKFITINSPAFRLQLEKWEDCANLRIIKIAIFCLQLEEEEEDCANPIKNST